MSKQNGNIKTSGADIIDWFRGSKMGYVFLDKLKIFSYILNATIVFFIFVVFLGEKRTKKFLLQNPKFINWIPIKNIQILLDGLILQIPAGFDYLLLVKSDWEHKERHFVSNLHQEGENTIIDVGANIGHYTNLLAKKYPNKKVYAIEASPKIFQNLQLNCKLNQLENVIFYNRAISNVDNQIIDFFERGCLSTINKQFLKDWLISDKYIKKIKINTMTLDHLIKTENLFQIDLLKIDIEGEELKALLGAQESLKSNKIKNLVIEYHRHSDKNEIKLMLEDFGYICTVDERPTLFENQNYANGHIFAVLVEN